MIDIHDVSKMLGLSSYTVKRWAEEGKFKFEIKEGEYFFDEREIQEFMSASQIKFIEPKDPREESKKFLDNYLKENKLMSEDEISKLIENLK